MSALQSTVNGNAENISASKIADHEASVHFDCLVHAWTGRQKCGISHLKYALLDYSCHGCGIFVAFTFCPR